jgi:hypothetical protein
MREICEILVLALAVTAVSGCGVRPVTGGTPGTVHAGDELLSDIQVTLHQVENGKLHAVGFGVTDGDGAFELVTNGARGPLQLPPGEYRCTLESAGAPLAFPREYARAETTPLTISWSDGDSELDLEVPVPTPVR